MNKRIEESRNAALKVLKLSKSELEHGLELHKDAFVMESYGFVPCAGVPAEKLAQCVETPEFRNACEQYEQVDFLRDPVLFAECKEAHEAAGVDAVLVNSGVEGNVIPELIKRLSRRDFLGDLRPELYVRAAWPHQLLEAKKNGRVAIYPTTNGIPVSSPVSIEESLYQLKTFFQFGVRMMHLTYNRRNLFGDGCAESADAGLSDLGRRTIAEMNNVGIIVDVAHSGLRTSLEAAEYSSRPIMASHTLMGAYSSHYRAKSDEVCRAIAKKNGLIGICCISSFLAGSGDINAFLNHIDYAVENFGIDHVAIGSDNVYRCGEPPALDKIPPKRPENEALWITPDKPFTPTAEMQATLAWTNFPLFTAGMVQHGHSDDDIRKILGLNVLRVCEAALKGIAI